MRHDLTSTTAKPITNGPSYTTRWDVTHAGGQFRFRSFYTRRAFRLGPALAVVTTVTVLGGFFVESPFGTQQTTAATAIGATYLVANFVIASQTGGYFDAPAESNPLLNTWSLSVEEQFYLIFPALLILGLSVALRRRRPHAVAPIALIAGATLLSLGSVLPTRLATLAGDFLPESLVGFYGPWGRVWEFGAGAIVALIPLASAPKLGRSVASALTVGGLALLLYSFLWLDSSVQNFGQLTLVPVLGTVMVLAGGAIHTSPIWGASVLRPLGILGDLSYSLYLWHWPLIVLTLQATHVAALAPVAALVALPVAWLSYTRIEQRYRHEWRRASPRGILRFLAMTVAVPTIVAAALWFGADNGFWIPKVRDFASEAAARHASTTNGCTDFRPRTLGEKRCTWNELAAGKPIYLVGDSTADHFSDTFVDAVKYLGRPLTVDVAPGCPFIKARVDTGGRLPEADRKCADFVAGQAPWLEGQPKGTVVIANSDIYFRDASWGLSVGDGQPRYDTEAKLKIFQAGLLDIVSDLQAAGHEVVYMQSLPRFAPPNDFDPASCSIVDIIRSSCGPAVPLITAQQQQLATRQVVSSVGEDSGMVVVDLADEVCLASVCLAVRDGQPVFIDSAHITVRESKNLVTPLLERFPSMLSGMGMQGN